MNIYSFFSEIRTTMFDSVNGDRFNVRNIAIIITDGTSSDRQATFTEAALAHEDGIQLLTVGIGITNVFATEELEGIASNPDEFNMFSAASFEELEANGTALAGEILNAICNSKCMMTSPNGSVFRVTGPLWGEFTGHRWIPLTKASDAELWCFIWSAPEWTVE